MGEALWEVTILNTPPQEMPELHRYLYFLHEYYMREFTGTFFIIFGPTVVT